MYQGKGNRENMFNDFLLEITYKNDIKEYYKIDNGLDTYQFIIDNYNSIDLSRSAVYISQNSEHTMYTKSTIDEFIAYSSKYEDNYNYALSNINLNENLNLID